MEFVESYQNISNIFWEKLDGRGEKLPFSAKWSDGVRVIHDTNTGLYVEVKSLLPSDVNYYLDRYTFEDACRLYPEKLNKAGYGGFTDWRLPNKDELRSILDYDLPEIAVDRSVFEHCLPEDYWTCNTYGMQPYFAWVLFFGLGSGISKSKQTPRLVMAVRGGKDRRFGTAQESRFVVNGDGTVTDQATGLIWQQGENSRMSLREAEEYCRSLELGGYTDWRLPNIKELNTILNLDFTGSQWYFRNVFPAEGLTPPLLHYFSSTPFKDHYAWVTNFCFGYDGYYGGRGASLLFRAVRNPDSGIVPSGSASPTPAAGQSGLRRPNEPVVLSSAPAQPEHHSLPSIYRVPHTGDCSLYDVEGNSIAKNPLYDGCDATRLICPMCFSDACKGEAVWDENTGLMWAKSLDPEETYTWQEAQDRIKRLNASRHLGFSDWRLPLREELRSIVSYAGSVPAIDENVFGPSKTELYWSAQEHKEDRGLAWGVYFGYGCCIAYPKTQRAYVRPVRAGLSDIFTLPAKERFTADRDTVTDTKLGLMWMRGETPLLTLTQALDYCRRLDLAGHTDWALPNIKELGTLINLDNPDQPWFFPDLFPDTNTKPQGFYLSSTTFDATFGWGCNFQFGFDGYYADRKNGRYPFRPVRRLR